MIIGLFIKSRNAVFLKPPGNVKIVIYPYPEFSLIKSILIPVFIFSPMLTSLPPVYRAIYFKMFVCVRDIQGIGTITETQR